MTTLVSTSISTQLLPSSAVPSVTECVDLVTRIPRICVWRHRLVLILNHARSTNDEYLCADLCAVPKARETIKNCWEGHRPCQN